MNYRDLQKKLHDQPFKPFRIRMVNNTTYDILEPWMLWVSRTSAMIVTRVETDDRGYKIADDWRTVAISLMQEFSDLKPPKSESRRKRAS
jgi:hypothetical protein